MNFLRELVTNRVLVSAVMGWFCAQAVKIILEAAKGTFRPDRILGGGGMPSAHSATVTALATAAGVTEGVGSTEFALALFTALIVIYDARGVRLETGLEAKALNRIREKQIRKGEEPCMEKPLEEQMGHTFPQIAAGMGVGFAAALLVCFLMRNV